MILYLLLGFIVGFLSLALGLYLFLPPAHVLMQQQQTLPPHTVKEHQRMIKQREIASEMCQLLRDSIVRSYAGYCSEDEPTCNLD